MPVFELLPNWVDDPQGEAVLKLLITAFKEDDYQSPGAAEVLLACCFPSYCNIDPANLQSLEADTFSAAMKVLDLNYRGIYAHQVIVKGTKIFDLLKKIFLQANQHSNAIPHQLVISHTTHH